MNNDTRDPEILTAPSEDYVRIPGLFRRWELEQVLVAGTEFHLEEAGTADDGTPLYALYQREQSDTNPTERN